MAQPNPNDNVHGGETAAGAGRPAGKSRRTAEPASAGDVISTGAFDKRDPYHLLKLFSVFSVASVAAILLLVGYGVYRIYSAEKIWDAEQDAVAVGEAIFEQEQKVLLKRGSDGRERIQVEREDFAALDARMRKYLRPFNMYKIKVFSSDKTIVYSTDHAIIGKLDSGNIKLDRVLQFGTVDSKLEEKDKVADLAGEERFNVDVVETYLPIRAGEAIIGSFEVYVDVSQARAQIPKVLTSSVAILFAVLVVVFAGLYVLMRKGALWLKQAQDELRALAATDMLTGIFNRRHLLSRIQEEYSRMLRERRQQSIKDALGFVMMDIDHFKATNDTYGHLVGDAILCEVSARLKRSLRAYDVVGRYGGEEFLAMLPHTDFEEAKNTAERMRQAICGTPFDADGASTGVTISAGVSYSANGGDDMYAAIRRADEALYQAKNAGRDRVAWV